MLRKIFLEHPADVGESYAEHFHHASGFGLRMLGGAFACFAHALLPAVFKTRGSDTIKALHADLVKKRGAVRDATIEMRSSEWVI